MHKRTIIHWFVCIALLISLILPAVSSKAAPSAEVTAFDLIIAMNTLRSSYGLSPLVEDPIIDAVAQSTAEIMAANQMSWHIGDVSGRLAAAGYGGGAKVWGTENFAVGGSHTIDTIMLVWSDDSHMIPAVNPAYCNIGAGVATSSNGMTYYVLQAAYTANKSCGEYRAPGGGNGTTQPGDGSNQGSTGSGWIVPVKIATPDADGNIYHVVEAGQSFWSIAIAYKITIKDLEVWNNLSKDSKLQIGQRLLIPGENTKGYSTPTPVGMVQTATPAADGKVVHTVQSYQTLSTIAQAYGIAVDTIITLNGIQIDWPLQIGQKLLIQPSKVTPSPTPRPLTPIEKLTPASDGRYYHIVQSGETLSWIAGLYEVQLTDLMAWNGLNDSSILYPDQKLLLQVTPPATPTNTPEPATRTATATAVPNTSTPTSSPSQPVISPTAKVVSQPTVAPGQNIILFVLTGLGVAGIFLIVFFSRKR